MSQSDYFYNKILNHFSMEPSECQLSLFRVLSDFTVQTHECDIMVVNGYAGTGKTSAIASYVRTLKEFNISFVLLAPTGRSAKVLANYTSEHSYTIHKQIYRQKSAIDVSSVFSLDYNKMHDTYFIVDEASLISTESVNSIFGTGNLLADLIQYVRDGSDNKLIMVGDKAQLPPISLDLSPALDKEYMSIFGKVIFSELSSVVRQAETSDILFDATILRKMIEDYKPGSFPVMKAIEDGEVERISGGDLIEKIGDAIDRYGIDETVVLCRSNKRANRYNAGIRSSVLYREEQLNRGDKIMVVKNCYQFVEGKEELDFIANGDVAELVRIRKYEERYGLHFAEATLMFPDYNNIEINAEIILDTLQSESASLTSQQQKTLYEEVLADYESIPEKKKRLKAVREDKYYNALQIKYATAITCHKSQGGQWNCVFIDNPFWHDIISLDDLKWLYTAITRGVKKVYLINFKDDLFR